MNDEVKTKKTRGGATRERRDGTSPRQRAEDGSPRRAPWATIFRPLPRARSVSASPRRPSPRFLRLHFIVHRSYFIVSSEAEHRVELKPRRRPVERAGRGRAERAEQTVGALVDDRGEGERDARVGGVRRDEAVHAHVRRLEEVGEVEGREDRVLLDA